jgi:hypothetical protein
MKVTRRQLPVLLAGAFPAAAQQQKAAPPDDPGELLKVAAERTRRNSREIAKYAVPASTEPAFLFRA